MLEWHASAVARSHAPLFLDCKWHGVKQSDSLVINALNKCCEPTGNAMPARLMTQTQKHWIGQSQLVAITCHSKWQLSKWGKYPAQCHTIELSKWYHSWAVGCGELPAHLIIQGWAGWDKMKQGSWDDQILFESKMASSGHPWFSDRSNQKWWSSTITCSNKVSSI